MGVVQSVEMVLSELHSLLKTGKDSASACRDVPGTSSACALCSQAAPGSTGGGCSDQALLEGGQFPSRLWRVPSVSTEGTRPCSPPASWGW